jgi:hypothetical protein
MTFWNICDESLKIVLDSADRFSYSHTDLPRCCRFLSSGVQEYADDGDDFLVLQASDFPYLPSRRDFFARSVPCPASNPPVGPRMFRSLPMQTRKPEGSMP